MTPQEQEEQRQAIVTAARAMIGTPWHHQGRVPGAGLDCVGLIICALTNAGIEGMHSETNYRREMDFARVKAILDEKECVQIPLEDALPGDIVFFLVRGRPQHSGIITRSADAGLAFIHAPITIPARVIEKVMTPEWQRVVHSVWRLPQLVANV